MKLLIISHTPHYFKEGEIVGWGPTIRELNQLLTLFDHITHIAPIHPDEAPNSALPYLNGVDLVKIKPSGGNNIFEKLSVFLNAPSVIGLVLRELKKSDWFQFRAPTGIGVFLIPYLELNNHKGWFKYAGNWIQPNPPMGYRLQRLYLKCLFRKKKVTINGSWLKQSPHLISVPSLSKPSPLDLF